MAVMMQDIKKYAVKANKVFFNNALDLNAIEFKTSSNMTKTLGRFMIRNGRQSITLSTLLFNQKEEWITTLVHELVHAWQWQTKKPLDHGWSFKQMAREIGRIAPEVIITRTRSSEFIDQAVASRMEEFGRKQYSIRKNDKVWFLRKLEGSDLTKLRNLGYAVAEASKVCPGFRNCKHISSLLTANYYYPAAAVTKVSSEKQVSWRVL